MTVRLSATPPLVWSMERFRSQLSTHVVRKVNLLPSTFLLKVFYTRVGLATLLTTPSPLVGSVREVSDLTVSWNVVGVGTQAVVAIHSCEDQLVERIMLP